MKAGEKAVSCGVSNASEIEELSIIKELHLRFWFFENLIYLVTLSLLSLLAVGFGFDQEYVLLLLFQDSERAQHRSL